MLCSVSCVQIVLVNFRRRIFFYFISPAKLCLSGNWYLIAIWSKTNQLDLSLSQTIVW